MILILATTASMGFVAGLIVGVVAAVALFSAFAPDPYQLRDDALERIALEIGSEDEQEAIVRLWGDIGFEQ